MAPREFIFVVNLAIARFTEVGVVVVAVDGGVGVVAQHARHHLGRLRDFAMIQIRPDPESTRRLALASRDPTRREDFSFGTSRERTDGAFYGPRWIGLGNARSCPRRHDRSRTSPRLGFYFPLLESRSARRRRPHLERQHTPRRAEWRMLTKKQVAQAYPEPELRKPAYKKDSMLETNLIFLDYLS